MSKNIPDVPDYVYFNMNDESDEEYVSDTELSLPVNVYYSISNMNDVFSILRIHFPYRTFEQLPSYDLFLRLFENSLDYVMNYISNRGRRFTGMRIQALVQDPNGLEDDQVINFRFDPDEVNSEFFLSRFRSILIGGFGWGYFNPESDEYSDSTTGKYVLYDISSVEFLHEVIYDDDTVTIVNGHTRIFGKYFIKNIDSSLHCLFYSSRDCIIIICNEFTGERYDPLEVRKRVWPNDKKYESRLFISSRIDVLCWIYQINIHIEDLINNTSDSHVINPDLPNLFLYKVGTCIGIADCVIDDFEDDVDFELDNDSDEYIFYDLETVQDSNQTKFRVYSFSFITNDEVITIADSDVDYVEEKLVDYILSVLNKKESVRYFLYAWNGSNFDHRILLSLLRDSKFRVSNVFVSNSNELLSAHIEYVKSPSKIILRDPCRVFPGSLDNIANLFGLVSKRKFNHDRLEQEFLKKDTWKDYFESIKSEILEYNTYDTRLVERVTSNIKKLIEFPVHIDGKTVEVKFESVLSRSMVAKTVWKDTLSESLRNYLYPVNRSSTDHYLPTSPYHKFDFDENSFYLHEILSEAIIGGRSQVPYGKIHLVDGIQIDARSMYPSQSIGNLYPYGKYHLSNVYVPEKVGLWRVRIISQKYPNVVPLRSKGNPLDWMYPGEMTVWITSVSVNQLVKYKSQFEVLYGIYWESSTDKYFESYMNYYYNERLRYKSEGNVIMDNDCKIKLNALTGSLLQSNFKDYVLYATSSECVEFTKKYHNILKVHDVEQLDNDIMIISFRLIKLSSDCDKALVNAQKDVCRRSISQNPNILTCFILEYSRACLLDVWTQIESPDNNCYMVMCDTDSLLFTNRNYVLDRMNELNLLGKSLGKWGYDFYNITRGYVIRPKFYAIRGYQNEDSTSITDKVKVRGVTDRSLVSTSSDQYLFKPFEKGYVADFNQRSIDYNSILDKIPNVDGIISEEDKKRYLGPKFRHVRSVYEGEYMQCIHFQMNKGFHGVVKKYCIVNLAYDEDF
jgi:hypothetical protein